MVMQWTGIMGSDNNTMAALNSKARVRGVAGLRALDASSFPTPPPGRPQITPCKCCLLAFIFSIADVWEDVFAEKTILQGSVSFLLIYKFLYTA